MNIVRTLLLVASCAVIAVSGFAAQDLVPSPASSDAPLGPHDLIEIKVTQDASLYTKAVVGDDGKVAMPLLNKIDVAGLTPAQVEARVKGLLELRYMTKADVQVSVLEFGSKPISVVGAVNHPGRIGVSGSITLLQAITQAGGLAAGYGKTLYVLRTGESGLSEKVAVDIDDLMVNFDPDVNLPLAPNDVVNVLAEAQITIYVLGEVMRPGTVQFRRSQPPSLLQVLAGVGGPTDRASRTVIIKRKVNGAEKTYKINYKRVISGKDSDFILQDNDTVFLSESII